MSKCSQSMYELIFELVLKKLERSLEQGLDVNVSCEALVIYVQAVLVFVKTPHPSSAGRSIIYRNWSRVCITINKIVNESCSIALIEACFSLTTFVIKDKV